MGPNATRRGEESGIANLTGAARSASEIAAWLLHEYCNPLAPLASIRIMLSPVEGERIHPTVEARMGAAAPATRAALEDDFFQFREACKANRDNVAFVYLWMRLPCTPLTSTGWMGRPFKTNHSDSKTSVRGCGATAI
jgi:hypothetical protein